MNLKRLNWLIRNYKGEMYISLISIVLGVILGTLANYLILNATLVELIIIVLLTITIIFMVLFSLKIKKNLTWKIQGVESLLSEIYGHHHPGTQYSERRDHFVLEKDILAKNLVRNQLPELIKQCLAENADLKNIAIVIDSGTTLAPVFPKLKSYGFKNVPEDIKIDVYTNSLSGITLFNLETGLEPYKVDMTQLHLLGGNPLEKYRATTGEDTQEALRDLRGKYCEKAHCLIIGIMTANWILVTRSYNHVYLCARGLGHHEFKKKLAEISDKIIIVAPLGKILRFGSPEELNQVLEEEDVDRYSGFDIDVSKRESTLFLTTVRRKKSSLFYPFWTELENAAGRKDEACNFKLGKELPNYDPKGSKEQQIEIEIPHDYMREYSQKAYGIIIS